MSRTLVQWDENLILGGGYAGILLTIELLLHGYHLSLQPAAAPGRWP